MTQLALFDLDHTLIPADSDFEWAQFLQRIGAVGGPDHERMNRHFLQQYEQGTLDMIEFLQFQLAPLALHPVETLQRWHAQYMREVIAPLILPTARTLVQTHLQRGDRCVMVTATNEFITAPIAQAFGIPVLIATKIERGPQGYTGKPLGTPNFRQGKVVNTEAWLAAQGLHWGSFQRTYFYSDSANDIPLMQRVTDPVATNPDERLARHAGENGWSILRLFDQHPASR